MKDFDTYHKIEINNDSNWNVIKKSYYDYYEKYDENKIENIPKIIHQIWLGSKIPEKYDRIIKSWMLYNPDWEYKLWTDDNISELDLINSYMFNKTNNYGIKSDILRYEILYKYGGIYIDTDFECFKSLNDLIYLDFFSGVGYSKFPEIYNGLIGSKSNHNLLGIVINELYKKRFNNLHISPNDVLLLCGSYFFTDIIIEYFKKVNNSEKNVIFPRLFFYSTPIDVGKKISIDNEESRKLVKEYINDEVSFCSHLWYSSWK